MNWVEKLAEFAKKLLKLQEQVEENTEEIKALHRDLKALAEFTHKVAYAVKSNRDKQEADHKILVLQLENELLKLENRLSAPNRFIQVEAVQESKRLTEGNGRIDGL